MSSSFCRRASINSKKQNTKQSFAVLISQNLNVPRSPFPVGSAVRNFHKFQICQRKSESHSPAIVSISLFVCYRLATPLEQQQVGAAREEKLSLSSSFAFHFDGTECFLFLLVPKSESSFFKALRPRTIFFPFVLRSVSRGSSSCFASLFLFLSNALEKCFDNSSTTHTSSKWARSSSVAMK